MEYRHTYTLLQATQSFMFDSVKYLQIEIKNSPLPKKTKSGLTRQLNDTLTTPKIAPLEDVALTPTSFAVLLSHIEEDLDALREFVHTSTYFFTINKDAREIIIDKKINHFKTLTPLRKIQYFILHAYKGGIEFYRYKKVCDAITLLNTINDGIDLFDNEISVNTKIFNHAAQIFKTFNYHLHNVHQETYKAIKNLNKVLSVGFDIGALMAEYHYEPVAFDPEHNNDADKIADAFDGLIKKIEHISEKVKTLEEKITAIIKLHENNLSLILDRQKIRPLWGRIFYFPTTKWYQYKTEKKIFILRCTQLNLLLNRERIHVALFRLQGLLRQLKEKDFNTSHSSQ